MNHFVLFYDFPSDFRERRGPYRAEHLAHCEAAAARGELVLAGAFAEDPPGSMLLFAAEGPGTAEAFARGDPYVKAGLALSWRVRAWTTVVGPGALNKIV